MMDRTKLFFILLLTAIVAILLLDIVIDNAIQRNKIDYANPIRHAYEDQILRPLPNQSETLGANFFAGYLRGDNRKVTQNFMYYWFIESQSDPENDPLVFYIVGGPAQASIRLASEPGLFNANPQRALVPRKYTKNKRANLLFIDLVLDVGFSYTLSKQDQMSRNESALVKIAYHAIHGFFEKFPKYLSNKFVIDGSSYGTSFALLLAEQLLERQSKINIRGLFLDQARLNDDFQYKTGVDYAYYHDFIDSQTYEDVKIHCCRALAPYSGDCSNEYVIDPDIHEKNLFPGNTISESCLNSYTKSIDTIGSYGKQNLSPYQSFESNTFGIGRNERTNEFNLYLNRIEVKEMINVPADLDYECHLPDYEAKYYAADIASESRYGLQKQVNLLLNSPRNIKILSCHGDADISIPVTANDWFFSQLNRTLTKPHQPWFVDNQLAGFEKQYGENLMIKTVLGGSHVSGLNHPRRVSKVLQEFLDGLD